MERNLRLYPWLHVGRSALFWLPVFVLYFSSTLSPAAVLRLEALYYVAVVGFEVPSGVLSDRLGRTLALRIAAVCWVAGSAVLAVGGGFWVLAAGQVLLAAGMAFQSGTDSALLFDTLTVLERPQELARREAQAQSWGYATLAISALIGGAAAGIDLRLGHALSALGGLLAVAAAIGMTEPGGDRRRDAPLHQLRDLRAPLRDPVLRWTVAWGIALTVWIHVPHELLQPWLDTLVGGGKQPGYAATPVVSGVVLFVVMGLASVAAPWGPRLAEVVGPRAALIGAWALLVAVIGGMALAVHPALLPVLVLRSVPGALARPVVAGIVHPRLPTSFRATWLSAEALAGRLAFSGVLALCAFALGGHGSWTPHAMTALLWPAAALGALVGGSLWWTFPRAAR